MPLNVTQEVVNEVKTALGWPLSDRLDFGDDTDQYIIDNVLARVVRVYFSYFPIKTDSNHYVTGEFEIPYPSAMVYRTMRHFFNYKDINYSTFSPFLLQAMTISRGSQFRDFGNQQVQEAIVRISTAESLVDFTKAVRVDDYPQQRKLKGFSNITGDLTVEWANFSNNFSDIIYSHFDNAIKLGKAYLLQDIYRLREQVKLQTKVEINTQAFLADAQRWEEEVIGAWRSRGFAVVLKN